MNLLALRIGRFNNYWTSLGVFKDSTLSPSVNSISNNLISRSPKPTPISIFENTLFNYSMAAPVPSFGSVRSFFFYSNSYGIFFILPIFSIFTKFSSLGVLRHSPSGALRSLFSSRITLAKSFILPHNDIDYLLNLFIVRFNHNKSFSNTLDILQSHLSSQKVFRPSHPRQRRGAAPGPFPFGDEGLGQGGPSFAPAFGPQGGRGPRPYNFQPSVGRSEGGNVARSATFPPSPAFGPLTLQGPQGGGPRGVGGRGPLAGGFAPPPSAPFNSGALSGHPWRSSERGLNPLGIHGLWGHISGLKLICNGRLNLNSALRGTNNNPNNLMGQYAGISTSGITRSKSFSFQWGNIPNNSSTNLSSPVVYRFKPFYTQKGSNSFHLFIAHASKSCLSAPSLNPPTLPPR